MKTEEIRNGSLLLTESGKLTNPVKTEGKKGTVPCDIQLR
jgi:hypothetical protein